ncbi:MAG TPA: aminotransferase class IV [Pseudolysinimonas sp.]|jgi:4-amino-4-deoxychorismate lyase|nr:aminotransferase class IV [Pseudolysinimonas sp.]
MSAPTGAGTGPTALAMIEFAADGGATLGHRFVPVDEPQLNVMDLSATRGDGIFETISLGGGHAQALDPHLRRFAHSAALLELPPPDLDAWREAVLAVAAQLGPVDEGFVKIVLTRGIEGQDVPTGWAYGATSPDHSAARTVGIRIVLLDRGYRHDVAQTSPWLLAGAKTLSYAVNRAAFREAARRGADDALFVSSDGYLLEGAVSNLVLRSGDELMTPRTDLGILEGTTQHDIFTWASTQGFRTSYELLTPQDLAAADAAWLVSSVRHAAAVRAVDGLERAVDREVSDRMNDYLRARTT